ncbi:MAG: fibronectin type III domain-containing protein, partial [Treponema sp.]|nr:fibronectin type III domain-containing protein [Treponema sp.]
TCHTFTGLSNGTQYTFMARAVNEVGGGIESIQTATPATIPSAPTGFAAVPGNSQVTLTWTTPGNGGNAITKYQYSYGATSGYLASWTDIPGSGESTTSYTVTSLTNGTNYTFEVRAVNSVGNGITSGQQTATPATIPSAPIGFTATPGNVQVTLSWTTPSDGGSTITKYQYSYGTTSGYSTSWEDIPGSGSGTTSYTVSGLTNGTSYAFEVRAVNSNGNGTTSGQQTATPATIPSAPTGFAAVPGNSQVTLTWTTPGNGGNAILRYQFSGGTTSGYSENWYNIPGSGPGTTNYTVSGLANGTDYTFEVRAVNSVGDGITSGQQTATPVTVPSAPGNFTAARGNTIINLTWTTPNDGGSVILKYQYSFGGSWTDIPGSDASTTSYTLSGLTNGTTYTVAVRAVNGIGNGTSSSQQAATPATTPSAPGSFTVTPGNGQVSLSWTTPNNGGSAILRYQYSYGVASGYTQNWFNIPGSSASTTSYTITSLTNGTNYNFEVRAVNSVGNGTTSGIQTATPVFPTYNVTFNSNGGSTVAPILNVVHGTAITAPTAPTISAGGATLNRFRGWFTDNGTFVNAFDFNTPITSNIILYADWGYRPGDTGPGTGTIYYRNETGFAVEGYLSGAYPFVGYVAHYLEVAPQHSNNMTNEWGASGTLMGGVTTITSIPHVDLNRIGNGRKDTITIIAHLAAIPEIGRAAQLAAAASFGGQNDWFLPSLGELLLLHASRATTGDIITIGMGNSLWSSSQFNSTAAWYIVYDDVIENLDYWTRYKWSGCNIRAIRAF